MNSEEFFKLKLEYKLLQEKYFKNLKKILKIKKYYKKDGHMSTYQHQKEEIVNICIGKVKKLFLHVCKPKCIVWELSRDNGKTWNVIPDECKPCLKVRGTSINDCYLYRGTGYDKRCCKIEKVFKLCVDFISVLSNPEDQFICLESSNLINFVIFESSYRNNADCGNLVSCKWQVSLDNGNSWTDVVPDGTLIIVYNNSQTKTCSLTLNDLDGKDITDPRKQYRAVFENVCGEVFSKSAKLLDGNQDFSAEIIPPQDFTICFGEIASFAVEAVGLGLTYQWTLDGNEIVGATESSYTTPVQDVVDVFEYEVLVENSCNSNSENLTFTLTVIDEIPGADFDFSNGEEGFTPDPPGSWIHNNFINSWTLTSPNSGILTSPDIPAPNFASSQQLVLEITHAYKILDTNSHAIVKIELDGILVESASFTGEELIPITENILFDLGPVNSGQILKIVLDGALSDEDFWAVTHLQIKCSS